MKKATFVFEEKSQAKRFLEEKELWEFFCNRMYELGENPLPIMRKLFPNLHFSWTFKSPEEMHAEGQFFRGTVVWHEPDRKFVVWPY